MSACQKQGVLILLDDQSPSKDVTGDGSSQTAVTPLINQSQCLPDLEIQPKPVTNKDDQTKAALEGLNLSDSQAVLPEFPAQQKEKPATPPPMSDPLHHHISIVLVSKQITIIFFLRLVVPAVWPFLITREKTTTSSPSPRVMSSLSRNWSARNGDEVSSMSEWAFSP